MYAYSEFDRDFLRARVAEFRGQVARRLDGSLSEDEFKPLRLMNGLYLQLHAYMLRVAIPYGTLSGAQMRALADISERWDRGYGHFTTRQNIQFNWPRLSDVPDMLEALAEVGMHAIQTSGNCIRNVTADHFAGAAAGEVEDPRLTAELIRQWSTDHPEFAYLPRKFKVAVTASEQDRAVIAFHDIGLRLRERDGEIGYQVVIGGGLGRTPFIGKEVRDWLPKRDLLAYLEAILRVYNLGGRRDNKYKARIKILVHETGLEELRAMIEAEFATGRRLLGDVSPEVIAQIAKGFAPPAFRDDPVVPFSPGPAFRSFLDTNLHPHKRADHVSVTVSTKPIGGTPGDVTAAQMRVLADLAKQFGYDELRISHEQNVILPHIHYNDLGAVYEALAQAGLATANVGLVSDIIACPGLDYCALATARSIPIAQQISTLFGDIDAQHDIGPLKIKISGCINACGHHHVGHIGILGLDRAGVENYQLTLGGDGTEDAALGDRTGPGFAYDEVVPAVERLIHAYLAARETTDESFLQTYRRVGLAPFKAALYGERDAAAA
ncbi:nitrite/sulfite reductase [uncultured Thioclava sp.]|uniref:nitrite/sulfite reductase n=1 Tax=uncultured Thioclava sp. TaxID=473858 RepID=UPI0025CDB722|nr:nitrite/sulfite reductase [uncultured Thioclava sp.]